MVLLHHDIVAVAFQMGLLEEGVLGQRLVAVAHAVALDVRLGHHIDAILVAKVVPSGIVAIVAGADGIHVQFLHDLDVLHHLLYADNISAVGVKLMTVHALEEDGLPVHQHLAVLDLHLAETDLLGYHLYYLRLVLQGRIEGVEVGNLGTPLARRLHFGKDRLLGAGHLLLFLPHLAAIGIDERQGERLALSLLRGNADLQRAVAIVVHQVGNDE